MAQYLSQLVESALDDLGEWIKDNPEGTDDDASDQIRDIADSATPVYNYDLLQMACGDMWLAIEEPEIEASNAIDCIKFNIYDHLQSEMFSKLNELRDELTPECDDCGKRFAADDLIDFDGELYCRSCFAEIGGVVTDILPSE